MGLGLGLRLGLGLGIGFGFGLGLGLGLGVGLERRCVRAVRLHVAMQLRRLHLQPYASGAATAHCNRMCPKCRPHAQSNYNTEPEP